MIEERVQFTSHGVSLVGNLFSPTGPAKGALVLSGPMTSVKEQATGAYAEAFARFGYAALAFDHRFFGESGGTPRQLEWPDMKVADIRSAADFLVSRFSRLPLFAVGICAGAGYIAKAVAADARFHAFAGIAGVYQSHCATLQMMGADYDSALEQARDAEQTWKQTGDAVCIPAVGDNDPDVAMPLQETFRYFGTSRGEVSNYVNQFAIQSRLYTLPFDAQAAAAAIRVPTIIIHSENALAPSLARSFYDRLRAPKRQRWLYSVGQIDFYDDPELIAMAAAATAAHFAAIN